MKISISSTAFVVGDRLAAEFDRSKDDWAIGTVVRAAPGKYKIKFDYGETMVLTDADCLFLKVETGDKKFKDSVTREVVDSLVNKTPEMRKYLNFRGRAEKMINGWAERNGFTVFFQKRSATPCWLLTIPEELKIECYYSPNKDVVSLYAFSADSNETTFLKTDLRYNDALVKNFAKFVEEAEAKRDKVVGKPKPRPTKKNESTINGWATRHDYTLFQKKSVVPSWVLTKPKHLKIDVTYPDADTIQVEATSLVENGRKLGEATLNAGAGLGDAFAKFAETAAATIPMPEPKPVAAPKVEKPVKPVVKTGVAPVLKPAPVISIMPAPKKKRAAPMKKVVPPSADQRSMKKIAAALKLPGGAGVTVSDTTYQWRKRGGTDVEVRAALKSIQRSDLGFVETDSVAGHMPKTAKGEQRVFENDAFVLSTYAYAGAGDEPRFSIVLRKK